MKIKIKKLVNEATRRKDIIEEQFGFWFSMGGTVLVSGFFSVVLVESLPFLPEFMIYPFSFFLFFTFYFKWTYELAMIRKHKDEVNKMFEKMRLPEK